MNNHPDKNPSLGQCFKKLSFGGILGLVCLFHTVTGASAQSEQRNVLIMISDDMGVDTMTRYGVGDLPANTPNLDALIDEGMLFENAWAYPICTPFRAAALTGRFGFRTGVGTVGGGNASRLPANETIIPEILDEHPELNIAHAAIGKWHLGGGPDGPRDHGFGHFAGVLVVPRAYFSWERSVNGRAAQETGYVTSVQVDDALDWIEGQTDKSWFMWLAFSAPHAPFHRPPDDLHTVDLPPGDPPEQGGDIKPYYRAAIEAIDSEIGRLLSEMDPAVRANTTIIFMGDNGTPGRAIGSAFPRRSSKGSIRQGGIWTPMIISGAGIEEPGRRVSHLAHAPDLMATSLDLLGLPVEEWPQDIDGQSLRPLMEDPDHPGIRDWAFSERFGTQDNAANDGKAIRDLRYKYLRFDDGREMLFDLETDPYERRELIAAGPNQAQSSALEALRARLDALLAGPPVTATPDSGGAEPTDTASVPSPTPNATETATASPESTPQPERMYSYLPMLYRFHERP